MIGKMFNSRWVRAALAILAIGAGIAGALVGANPVQAHCDSEKGPVATAAHQALQSGNVKLVLPYVKPDSEVELTAAFKQALAVRKGGKAAQELADRYFIETAIRLHRAGEGAAYTGVTDENIPKSILIADQAIASGSTSEVLKMLDAAIRQAVEEKYQAVAAAGENAKRLNTVEAHRERVEAELTFEKFIYELTSMVSSDAPLTEGHTH